LADASVSDTRGWKVDRKRLRSAEGPGLRKDDWVAEGVVAVEAVVALAFFFLAEATFADFEGVV